MALNPIKSMKLYELMIKDNRWSFIALLKVAI